MTPVAKICAAIDMLAAAPTCLRYCSRAEAFGVSVEFTLPPLPAVAAIWLIIRSVSADSPFVPAGLAAGLPGVVAEAGFVVEDAGDAFAGIGDGEAVAVVGTAGVACFAGGAAGGGAGFVVVVVAGLLCGAIGAALAGASAREDDAGFDGAAGVGADFVAAMDGTVAFGAATLIA